MMMKLLRKIDALWNKRNNKSYVKYLRKEGASIGHDTTFINQRHASVDSGRIKYLSLGDNCVICSGVSFIMHDYSWYVIGNKYHELYPSGGQPIEVGNNVFIGAHSLILGNTKIGDNVIIAAGSVVKGILEPDMIYGGNPARPIMTLGEYRSRRKAKYIDEARIEVDYYRKRFGRNPREEEMKNFEVLFSDRSQTTSKHVLGFEGDTYTKMLIETPCIYASYSDFLEAYQVIRAAE